MPRKFDIEFVPADRPIKDLVTKFGGQPVWISKPAWPLSKGTGEKMMFIGQISLSNDLFGQRGMAYVFMTDDSRVDGTWEPDGGENAVLIQLGERTSPETSDAEGPTLHKMVPKFLSKTLVPKPCEFAAKLIPGEDPDFLSDKVRFSPTSDEAENEKYFLSLQGNKIGGVPGFMQADEFPSGGPWKLLFQLDSTQVPFFINFGDCGIGYGFISEDGTQAKFLWQCC